MKKLLLALSVACTVFSLNSGAQVIWSQDFEGVAPGLPSGWTQGSTGAPGWKTLTWNGSATQTGWGTALGGTLPNHAGNVAVIDDWNDSGTVSVPISNLHDTLKTPVFSLAASPNAWFNFTTYFVKATRTATGKTERAYVLGSTDGGSTWSVIDSVDGGTSWNRQHVNLSPLASAASARLGIRYTDATDHLLGCAIDSAEVSNLSTSSAAVTSLAYNSSIDGISANGQPVGFTLLNNGLPITSFRAKFTINGGTPITQSFTGVSQAPYVSTFYQFTSTITGAVAGTNTIVVTVDSVNGISNPDADPSETSTFLFASEATNRQGLIEEFSSSTCPPCASFNSTFDPLCVSMAVNTSGTDINVIKYQMNWPSPGNDRSYNSDGSTRRGYYGVSGIPDHFVNGLTSNISDLATQLTSSKALQSFMDMSVNYMVDTTRSKMGVIVTVTPHFTKAGSYTVHTVVMDKYYENTTNTTGQLKYYHVMRKCLPSGSGHAVSAWADGVAQSFVDTGITYTNGNYLLGTASYPTQGDNKFWNSLYAGSEVVCFVQDNATKSVMQSVWSLPAGLMSVSTLAKVDGISVFPNPTKDGANLKFNLQEAGNVSVSVLDYTGKMLTEVVNENMTAGVKNVKIDTKGMTPGNYIVMISANGGNRVERLTVE
jgi:hypothetical protein